MDSVRWTDFNNWFKNTFTKKRTKITLYIVVVLWVAVATQVVVNRAFHQELQITEAFIKSEAEEIQSSLEIVSEYKSDSLSEEDKKEMINNIAKAIGLTVDGDIKESQESTRSEYYYFKQAKQASTEIRVVSLQEQDGEALKMKHYIIVRLNILKGIQSIDKYKTTLEKALKDLGAENIQVTLKYEGNREGDLTSIQKHEIATKLVEDLQGKIAIEYDEGDLYTVYAYTGMLNEYVTSMDNKINIQIAITYNETTNKTRIALATPVLNEGW